MAANSQKQAQQLSHEIGQHHMVSSMFFEIPSSLDGAIPGVCAEFKHADNKIFCFSRVIHSPFQNWKMSISPVAPLPATANKKTKPWPACNSFQVNFFQAWTEWEQAPSQMWSLSLRMDIVFLHWSSLPLCPPLCTFHQLKALLKSGQTLPFQRPAQSRKKEGREEPF